MNIDSILKKISSFNGAIAMHQERFPAEIEDFRALLQDIITKANRFSFHDQPLSIGIMGQVKAGKSTFLNALLFDGHPILPEAATPKTANLTRIIFGEKPTLFIHYYSIDEWTEICNQAASSGNHTEARVARDLVDMVKKNGVIPSEILSKNEEPKTASNLEELLGLLNEYVGQNGRYTALVKSTEISLPLDELRGLELVDTPGMNDPVPSRTQKTREYMAKCDVVFFLTRCSQFLDQSDMNLLALQLPSKGVKRIILVAGQYDSAILDDGYDRSSLFETEKNLREVLSHRAENELERLAITRDQQGAKDIAQLLRAMKPLIFASTYAYGFAEWPSSHWSSGMKLLYSQLLDMAKTQWAGYQFSLDDWIRIANFEALRSEYARARSDKEKILEQQRNGIVPDAEVLFYELVKQLSATVINRREQLINANVNEINEKKKLSENRLKSLSLHLSEPIDITINNAWKKFNDLKSEMQNSLASALILETQTGLDMKTTTQEISTSKWFNPFTWGTKKTVISTFNTSYEYIAGSDAIEKIVEYKEQNVDWLSREFHMVISSSRLKYELKNAMIAELDTDNTIFNLNEFRTTLNGAIDRVRIPDLILDVEDPTKEVQSNFQGQLRGDNEITQLRKAYQDSIKQTSSLMLSELERSTKILITQLEELKNTLTHVLTEGIRNELDLLEKAFKDKQEEINQYDNILNIIDEYTQT